MDEQRHVHGHQGLKEGIQARVVQTTPKIRTDIGSIHTQVVDGALGLLDGKTHILHGHRGERTQPVCPAFYQFRQRIVVRAAECLGLRRVNEMKIAQRVW